MPRSTRLLLVLFSLLFASTALAQSNPHVLRLARVLPKSEFVLVLDKLDQGTLALDLLLKKIEVVNPFGIQLRGMISGMEQRLGVSLLSPSFWQDSGIGNQGAVVVSEIRQGRSIPVLGFSLQNPKQFETFLQKFAALGPGSQFQRTAFKGLELVSLRQPVGEASSRTLFSYVIRGNLAFFLGGDDRLTPQDQPSPNEAALQKLLALPPTQSLATHPRFLSSYRSYARGKAFLFGENKRRTKFSLAPGVRSDFEWLSASLDWNAGGLTFDFYVGLGPDPDFQRYAPLFRAPQSAPGQVLKTVHPSALTVWRAAFDTQGFYREILKEAQKSDPAFSEATFLQQGKTRLGIDIKQDFVDVVAGQIFFVFYGSHPDIIAYAQNSRRPNVLGRLLDAALLLEITDASKGLALLRRIAQTPELKATESSPGVFQFAFDPNFPLFATVKGRSLILALGQKALNLSLQGDAMPFAVHRKTLTSRQGLGGILNFLTLRALLSQLSIPAQQRMILSMALPALAGLHSVSAQVKVAPRLVVIRSSVSLTP